MPYPEYLVAPMRAELTRFEIEELKDAAAVDAVMEAQGSDDTLLLIVNSVCGCAAANARPAVALALQNEIQPDRMVTVFAGQDLEATARAREHMIGIPPSSPFMALFHGGDPVYVIERRHIEGRSASAIAMDLVHAFNTYCGADATPAGNIEMPDSASTPDRDNGLPKTFRSIM